MAGKLCIRIFIYRTPMVGRPSKDLQSAFHNWMSFLKAVFGTLTLDVMFFTILYSIAGLGIAIVNDFKSIEGDRYVHDRGTAYSCSRF